MSRRVRQRTQQTISAGMCSETVAAAGDAGCDLSASLERATLEHVPMNALAAALRQKRLHDDKEATTIHDDRVDLHGTWSGGLRGC